jgi:hypothetical protein
VRVLVGPENLEVRLARWQKVAGLLRDITVPRASITDVSVLEEAVSQAMGTGPKVGLRIPWLYYVARTIKLDEAFIVRRGVPALCVAVDGEGPLKRLLLSTREAQQLAERLRSAP